jgi:tetratricopeptide (TPR) repeat protein
MLATKPESAEAYVVRGELLLADRDYALAAADFDSALAMDPKSARALADRGIARYWRHDLDRARQDLDAALILDPRSSVAYRGRGMLAAAASKLPAAIQDYSHALEINPADEQTRELRAGASLENGDYAIAAADGAWLIHQQPDKPYPYKVRAWALYRQLHSIEAAAVAGDLMAANPSNVDAFIGAGQIYHLVRDDAAAVRAMDRAVAMAPVAATVLERAAMRPKSDLAGALTDVAEALRLQPNMPDALRLRAQLLRDSGRYAEAVADYSAMISVAGELADLLTQRAIAYAKGGHPHLAADDARRAIETAKDAEQWNDTCWDMATANVLLDESLRACRLAVAKEPLRASYLDSRAFVLLRLGRFREALETYDAALKEDATMMISLYCRGIVKRRLGRIPEGDADIRAARLRDADVAGEVEGFGVRP